MAFNIQLEWSNAGYLALRQKSQQVAVVDQGAYANAVARAIGSWGQTLHTTYPGLHPRHGASVVYDSQTAPTPKTLPTNWNCDVANWQADVGMTLTVVNVR